MKWRWVAAIVCALYMSVGLAFAAAHDHSGDALDGHQQCAACAWHHDGQVDVPTVGVRLSAPQSFPIRQEVPAVFVFEVSVGLHGSRGPPSIPQL